jgi:D-tyrosyl-tRNA(Tyr) deacylase
MVHSGTLRVFSWSVREMFRSPAYGAVMRALVQRVTQARVTVAGEPVGEIGTGLLVLIGVTHDDTPAVASRLAEKVGNLRVFDDADGIMNRTLLDVGGSALVVSQFTLYGDARKGRRPSFIAAAPPELAERLYESFASRVAGQGVGVAMGRFRAHMLVSLVNDGPVTLWIDTEENGR